VTVLRSAIAFLVTRLGARPQGGAAAIAAGALALLAGLAVGSGGSGPGKAALQAATASPAAPRHRDRRAQAASREARAIERTRRATAYVSRGSPRHREIALTFDDGPGPDTPRIVRELRRLHAPATFFFVGQQVDLFGPMLRLERERGFAIGNHTQNHPPLGRLPANAQLHQLRAAAQRGRRYGVDGMRLFRPPYGSYNRATLQVAHRLGLLMVLWSADTGDYRRPGADAIIRAAVRRARPGGIVLMHDGGGPRQQTVKALPHIVHQLRRRGFRLVTVPQMLADSPVPRHQRPPPGIGQ
jgi:peptidoglycan/xylan/chitin deacetylase (PgdA/CDA1 family)